MSRFLCGHTVQTHNNSLSNLVRGVGERVLFINKALDRCIKPKSGIFERKLALYRNNIAFRIGRQSPVARDLFPGYYRGPRQALYQRAVEDLVRTPVRPKDAMLKTFVKAEKLNLSLKSDPVPRVIQPRSPRFNVEVGRYLRPIEHRVYEEIDNLFKSPTIMSPYNSYEQAKHIKAKWDSFIEPVCIGLDASRFDQHVSAEALQFEHELYNRIYCSPELAWLLKLQIKNKGVAVASDGHFWYDVIGSRMSGDMNTSLGNKLLMCLMAYQYIIELNIDAKFINNGDDCLLFIEKRNLGKLLGLKPYFLEFGFNIVTEDPVYEFERVVFCQTSPICCNGIWRMVRNVKTCMTKDVTSINVGHDVTRYREVLKSIGDCGLATCADVPILGAFYRMLSRFGLSSDADFSDRGYSYYYRSSKNATCTYSTPDSEGRLSFFISNGICPDVQECIEQYFDTSVWGEHNFRQEIILISELLR